MPDLLTTLGHESLTGVVQQFEFPQFQIAPRIPVREMDGDVAEWTVEKWDIEIHPYFVGRSGNAEPLRHQDYGKKTFGIPYRFVSKTLDAGLLAQLDKPGTREYDAGVSYMDAELRRMQEKVGAYTDEWLVCQALQGSLTIKIGNADSSVSYSVDYEIPAGNQLSASTVWTNTSANILEDLRRGKDEAAKHGAMLGRYILNDYTANLIHRNTTLQNYFKEYNAGRALTETGNLPPLLGLQPLVVSGRYADTGQTDRFEKKFIADGKVVLVPEFPNTVGDWIEFQAATMYVPDDDHRSLRLVRGGVAAWSRVEDNPPALTAYLRIAKFPVIRQPWKVVILTVT